MQPLQRYCSAAARQQRHHLPTGSENIQLPFVVVQLGGLHSLHRKLISLCSSCLSSLELFFANQYVENALASADFFMLP